MNKIFQTTKVLVLAAVFSLGLSYALAWTAPTAVPPTGNVSAPINTSGALQTIPGPLKVNTVDLNAGNITNTWSILANSLTTNEVVFPGGIKQTKAAISADSFEIINAGRSVTYTRNYTGKVLIIYSANAYEGAQNNMGWRFYLNGGVVNGAVQVINYQGGLSPVWYQRYDAVGNFTVKIDIWGTAYVTTPQIIIYYL